MRTLTKITVLFLASYTFISCSSESSDTGNNNPEVSISLGSFKATIDGQNFVANSTKAVVTDKVISISGEKADGSLIQISLTGVPAVGTYTSANAKQMALLYSEGTGQLPYVANPSLTSFYNYKEVTELKILAIDKNKKTIKGTFKFNGGQSNLTNPLQLNVKGIVNGEFNVNYTTEITTITNNSISAKIDGKANNFSNIIPSKLAGFISIRANINDTTAEGISIAMPENVTSGTTLMANGTGAGTVLQYFKDGKPENIYIGTGSVVITNHDKASKRITGTFNFVAKKYTLPTVPDVVISEGKFDFGY